MPKRKADSEEEKWLRKKKKYERKLEERRRQGAKRRRYVIYSDNESEIEEGNREDNEVIPANPNEHEDERQSEHESSPGSDVDGADKTTDKTADLGALPDADGAEPGEIVDPENIATDDFDPTLLRELGDIETDPVEYGDSLQNDVAGTVQKILLTGLKKEIKEELLKKYPYPKNVPLAKGPTLNPEISAMLVETCKQRDKRLLAKQDQLGKALSAVGKALTGLLKKTPDIPEAIRTLNDASKLIADSHYAETDTRRSVIIPLIDKSLSDPFKDRKRDAFLFGEKLGDLVKDSRGIKKTGQLIQAPSTSGNLNTRGSSSRAARPQRSGQAYLPRAGGPRTAPTYPYQYSRGSGRRAAGPLPPPPPARRPPPPPPPPLPPPRRSQPPPQRTTR